MPCTQVGDGFADRLAPYACAVRAVRVRVPAKINLQLAVGPRRDDGFHELRTVFHAVDVHDEVTARPGAGLDLTLTGVGADALPADDGNLAWRAAALLAARTGVPADAHLALHKDIPVAGGMAGGSADAAATLLACARLWAVEADLPALAAELGSDVAFPLLGGTAVGTGRGEVLRPVTSAATLHWVLVPASFGISAGAAYAELDRQRAAGTAPEPVGPADDLLTALATGDLLGVAANLGNDLEPAALALAPQLAATLDAGQEAGALAGLVSGSGPTCAFLCADAALARSVADRLVADRLVAGGHAARTAIGPATGAHVVA